MLLAALASIFETASDIGLEVIVVDNNSQDGSAEAVANRFPQVILQANRQNTGYAAGNNQALSLAHSPLVLLLNPDVLIPEGALQTAVKFMADHPDAGAMGAKQLYPDGRLQRSVRGFPTPIAVTWELLGLSRLFSSSKVFGAYRMTWFNYDSVIEVDQPMGTFLMLRKAVIEQVGMLDEQFTIFFNEVDWCLRCKRAGWRIFFSPDVTLTHYGGASTSQVGPAMAWESRRGLLQFYAKHYRAPLYLPLRLIIAGASWPHAWLQARRQVAPGVAGK